VQALSGSGGHGIYAANTTCVVQENNHISSEEGFFFQGLYPSGNANPLFWRGVWIFSGKIQFVQ